VCDGISIRIQHDIQIWYFILNTITGKMRGLQCLFISNLDKAVNATDAARNKTLHMIFYDLEYYLCEHQFTISSIYYLE
jgi:hypothetical protein